MKKTRSTPNTKTRSVVAQDFKNAVLVISLLINAFVLTTWLVARLSPELAAQLARLI